MTSKRLALVLLTAALLAPPAARTQAVLSVPSEVEALLGLRIDERGLTFQVESSGCTKKGDFEVQVFDVKPRQFLLLRTRPDLCEAVVPYGKRIRFSFAELGIEIGDRIRVLNPLATVQVARG